MVFEVKAYGRRLSDGQAYELRVHVDAADEKAALDAVESDYDWDDAATRNLSALPAH